MQLQDVERRKLSEGGWGEKEKKSLLVSSLPFPQVGFLVVGSEFGGRDKDHRISGLVYTGAI